MSAACNFDMECVYVIEDGSQDQPNNKQRRASERAKSLSRKRQQFERARAAYSMPPRRGAPHRAARSATRTSLAGGVLESGADIPMISVPDRQNLQRNKQSKKASVAPMLKPSLRPVEKPPQQVDCAATLQDYFESVDALIQADYTATLQDYSESIHALSQASATPNPMFWPSAEALPACLDSIEEDALDMLIEDQLDVPACEDKEVRSLDRQQALRQLMDKLCAQNGGLQQKQVAAAQIQELFIELEAEVQGVQKKSKATQETQPLFNPGKWPKLEEGAFNVVGRFLEKAEARLGNATVGLNEHIGAIKLSTENLTSWPSNNPLQQQSEKVVQNLFEVFEPVWQGAECLAKDAQSELTKTAAVVTGKPPSFKTWLEDPFASVSRKLEAASQKFEADASRFMDHIEAYTMPKNSSMP